MPYFFFCCWSPSFSLYTVFNAILWNIDEVISINRSANAFVFRHFNAHNKDWITYSSGTVKSFELCCNFSISDYLIKRANFPTWICDCESHSPAFLDLLISTDPSICSTVSFPLISFDHVVVSVYIDFPHWLSSNTSGDTPLTTKFVIILMLIEMVFEIIWETFCGRISLKLCYFCCCSDILWADQFRIVVFIPIRSFPWFSTPCAATIAT